MQNAHKPISAILLPFLFLGLFGCLDELDIPDSTDETAKGILVVEAVLTDEIKTQQVYLSRADSRFDLVTDTVYNPFVPLGVGPRDSVKVESGAQIGLVGDDGTILNFVEGGKGTYLSTIPFGLADGVEYHLEVRTAGGTEYSSDLLKVEGHSQLTDVYAERTFNDLGEEGMAIYADSQPQRGNTRNYRFAYEETYKIIAPYWSSQDFLLENYDPCALPEPTYDLNIVPREVQNQICYNTVASNVIKQYSSHSDPSQNIQRFLVRFIKRDNFIISHRYSILVKQYVQSEKAFSYFQALDAFAGNNDLFSQVQPGLLEANMNRTDGKEETVLGYVEVVGASQKRIFFDYEDFFPGEDLPPYPFNCSEHSSPESHLSYCFSGPDGGNPCPQSIIERVHLGLITYTGLNHEGIGTCPGPYKYVNRICGDCTLLGKNSAPEFWIE